MTTSRAVAVAAVVLPALLASCVPSRAAISADEVTALPGWDGPLPSKQYSGYLTVGQQKDRHIHYWFSESLGNPSSDPVVLWLNGGPGASSLIGAFTELGVFALNSQSVVQNTTAAPKLFQNPYTWNAHANMLYLESPAGVGFSYCEEKADCFFNDTSTAEDNFDALVAFFAGFSEFKANAFLITGESYAGIYIPTLVQQIDAHPAAGINLKGFAIGDGCIGDTVGSCSPQQGANITVRFLFGMGMYSQPLHDQILATCTDFGNPTEACRTLLHQMDTEAGTYDVYNVFDECGENVLMQSPSAEDGRGSFLQQFGTDPATGKFGAKRWFKHPQPMSFTGPASVLPATQAAAAAATAATAAQASVDVAGGGVGSVGGALNDYLCGGEAAMRVWLSQPSVQQAIHVKTNVPKFNFNYTRTLSSLLPAYPGLIAKYKVLIYSGSVDACVPYVGSEEWTRELGIPVKTGWTPWTYNRSASAGVIRGGYEVVYDSNDFTFLTVAGSGHMVPQYQPPAALAMFNKFLGMVGEGPAARRA